MNKFKAAILDIDGVLLFHDIPYPGAMETLRTLRQKGIVLRFLTNSSLKSRLSCAEGLQKLGFEIFAEEIITASYATAVYLRGLKPRSCWVLQEDAGADEFKEFVQSEIDPEYVVVGDNRSRFNFETMNQAMRLLRRGAGLIGTQSELVDTSEGDPILDVGAWVQMLENTSGVKAVYIGKPHPFVYELALSTIPCHKSEVVMIGDKVSTDIVGGQNAGLKTILLKTGEFESQELQDGVQPDYAFDAFSEVLPVII